MILLSGDNRFESRPCLPGTLFMSAVMHRSPQSDERIFADALDLPAGERARFLHAACEGDSDRRKQIEALLEANDLAENFMVAPRVVLPPEATDLMTAPLPLAEDKLETQIGRYKLLQKIGEGGCGVVYMAEQEKPVRRRVALKVIKLGMDTKAVIARFEAERQALAMMDHPNIARVLDAGATETGRPYFVMELVRGVRITEFCDQRQLSAVQRLKLFTQVCLGVQHAHHKGIIHRDLKPANILVTINDGLPVPKIIDFGIAKATQGRLTDCTVFTAFEQFIGTPAYMSPEQAEMSSLDVDTRSDIYSLGVLLYELLTGRQPFDAQTLREAGIDEIRRLIREVEPPKPSTRLGTLSETDRTTAAKLRGTDVPKLSLLLCGDIDWIVMKALDKNRERRYETASALAADISHHLRHEPVLARPPSMVYLLQKLIRRNRRPSGDGGGVCRRCRDDCAWHRPGRGHVAVHPGESRAGTRRCGGTGATPGPRAGRGGTVQGGATATIGAGGGSEGPGRRRQERTSLHFYRRPAEGGRARHGRRPRHHAAP